MLGAFRGDPAALCTSGGYTVAPAAPTLALGEDLTLAFSACTTSVLGDPLTLDGSAPLTIATVTGDPATAAHGLAADLGTLDLTAAGADGSTHVTGAFRFARTAAGGDLAEQATSPSGTSLHVAESGGDVSAERWLSGFTITSSSAAAGGFTAASAGDALSLAASGVAGALSVSVSEPFQGTGGGPPDTGELRVEADDGSNLTLTVGSGGAVSLGVDADGDGIHETTVPTTWDELR